MPLAYQCLTDPWASEQVKDILQKIEIGTDLMEEQKGKVTLLIKEYTDVFALNLSEVQVVDWYKHHLDVDLSIKLTT